MRTFTKKEDGSNLVEDALPLEEEKARRISEFKQQISKELLEVYPYYKQLNASLGVYDEEECNNIKAAINSVRDKVTMFETMVDSCATSDELAGSFDVLPVLG